MLTRLQRALFAVLVVGGVAVLASYGQGYLAHPDIRWDIWGGIPSALRPLYTVSMFAAAVGYIPLTLFILLRLDPSRVRFAAPLGYGVFVALYALVLAGSAAWMPLTYRMIEDPSHITWIAIRVTLGIVALASISLLLALLRLDQRQPAAWYRLAVAGSLLFCWQTVVLDAIVWPHYFLL
jgi:hypothetical protein